MRAECWPTVSRGSLTRCALPPSPTWTSGSPMPSPRDATAQALRLALCPIGLDEANAFVAQHHRHHRPVVGHKFSIGAARSETVVGVAIVSRPVARRSDDGWTLEVTRLCSDGSPNVCSFPYGAS